MILDVDYGEPDEPVVTIRMTKAQAEWAQSGLSDIACWARGFNAALKEGESDRSPMGLSEIRELNIALKKALDKVDQR
ncbi:hypothetical protein TAL182_CH03047 [Rhizobium sp. TAL182]|uniref:hypothetical protein n=1 Tax=Rhizobium sp. TAL182 TaxID=2020313 RepID=UPI000A2110F1|nr:hypothetical protein [Rhizobium sp. TAL182]ARO24792.1 hypothetical protein TAL182_CH03047 [Rhizobium sp. TAL182]